MAREKVIQSYFPHDSNARSSDRIINLRMRHSAAGYGVFFMIVERLREEADYMSVRDYNIIAFDLRVDASLVKSVVEDFGLFVFTDDGKYFYSESLRKRMLVKDEKRKARSEAGKKGMEKRWGNNKMITKLPENDNKTITHLQDSDNKKSKVNKRENKFSLPPNPPPGEEVVVGADEKERIVSEFFSKQIAVEAFCKNNGTTPEKLRALVDEIFTEWELSNEKDITEKHLINTLRIKLKLNQNADRTDNQQERRGRGSATRGKIEPGCGLIE